MYEKLFGALLSHPWAVLALGRLMMALALMLGGLGLRVGRAGRRLARVFERIGAESPDVMAGFPWWLRPLVPETTVGWVAVVVLAATGGYMAYLGKWAKKQI